MSKVCPVCNEMVENISKPCPFCGFSFKDSTTEFAPIDISGVVPESSTSFDPRALLRIVNGPQNEGILLFNKEKMVIGRNPSCDLFLNDMTVSRNHAEVCLINNRYFLNDLNSFNGTWVNNISITSKMLVPSDVIQIGNYCLVFEQE